MMPSFDEITVYPGRPLIGTCALPGDKSISHRYALFAAMAKGESLITNFLDAGVTQVMLTALKQLGVEYQLDGPNLIVNSPGILGWQPSNTPIYCGNSATTMRLLAGALAARGIPAWLDGSTGLRHRPMGRIIEPLQLMGVPIISNASSCAPLELLGRASGQALHSLDYTMPVASAQVKSCLLIAALAADGPITLHEPGPSRDHTERLLKAIGISVACHHQHGEFVIRMRPPEQIKMEPFHLSLPGDISSAAFLIVAALITPGSLMTLKNVGINPTRTGLLDALQSMGGQIEINGHSKQCGEPVGDITVCHSELRATTVSGDMVIRMIDEFPAFAVAASFADGETVVRDAQELRLKESDRIAELVSELNYLGVNAIETGDGFMIHGGGLPSGGKVSSHGDHRLAMALALLGLSGSAPVTVRHAGVIGESFPDFPQVLEALGAEVQWGPIK